MTGQETRNKLTDYWKEHEITKDEYHASPTHFYHLHAGDHQPAPTRLNAGNAQGKREFI